MRARNSRHNQQGPDNPTSPRPIDLREPDPSQNALKHGLCVLRPRTDAERNEMEECLDIWLADNERNLPIADHALVTVAATGIIRMKRCREADEAARERLARNAHALHVEKLRHKARRQAQDFPKDPRSVLEKLESTAVGVEWLLGRWRRIEHVFHQAIPLAEELGEHLMHMQGLDAVAPDTDAPHDLRVLWANLLKAIRPGLDLHDPGPEARKLLGRFIPPPESPRTAPEARAFLRPIVDRQLESLQTLLARHVREEREDKEHPEFNIETAVDESREGRLIHRYFNESWRMASKAFTLLNERAKLRHRFELLELKKLPRYADYEAKRRDDRAKSDLWGELVKVQAAPPEASPNEPPPPPAPPTATDDPETTSATPTSAPTTEHPGARPRETPASPAPRNPSYPPQTDPDRPETTPNRPTRAELDPDPGH